ncbi:MAG TPA: sigma 54-interacting transcriptional regulator [Planctomycetota bacterium]|nr:sigma 54-interacting transcriptional regulator [Planctomycetota bacterium]
MFQLRIQHEGFEKSVLLAADKARWAIGRAEGCEIQVSDRRVSNQHAELLLQDSQLVLKRTSGQRPIEYQGRAVESLTLAPGATFRIGHTEFTLVLVRDGMNLVDAKTVLSESSLSISKPQRGVDESGRMPAATSGLQPALETPPARAFSEICALLSKADSRETLAAAVLELACSRLNATRALLARILDNQQLEVIASRGLPADSDVRTLVSTTILKQIVDNRQAVFISNALATGSPVGQQASIVRNHIQAVACAPVFSARGNFYALLYADNQDRNGEFSPRDAELLIWLGQLYSLLDENLEMRRRLSDEIGELKRGASAVNMIAEAPVMLQLLERAKKAAASDAAVLVLGESGSGKENIARLLHQQSPRAKNAFVARNCAAIPENLFESEMFGHKKGSFTGADSDRRGAFQEAQGGTLFLDEIGDLSYALQTKLLRAIQEKLIRPVGHDHDISVDVRLICATNRNLREDCKEKRFREDLYYRISTVTLNVPPLRERREEILPLARYFCDRLSSNTRKLSPDAEQKLLGYEWPGNVRELRSIIEQAVIFASGSDILPDDIVLPVRGGTRIDLGGVPTLAEVEKRHILHVLDSVNGNKTEAAKQLGLARSTLVLKLQSYGRS